MNRFAYIFNRLKEPSTLAAGAVVASVFGASPEKIQTVGGQITAVLALIAMFLPDPGSKKE